VLFHISIIIEITNGVNTAHFFFFFRLRAFFFFVLLDRGLSPNVWTPRPECAHAFSYNSMLIGSIFDDFAIGRSFLRIEPSYLQITPIPGCAHHGTAARHKTVTFLSLSASRPILIPLLQKNFRANVGQ